MGVTVVGVALYKAMESEEISWIFSAEVLEHRTPSREHGISAALERQYRREAARFIINASNTLKLYPLQ